MDEALHDRLRFYQELGFDSFFRRRTKTAGEPPAMSAKAAPAKSVQAAPVGTASIKAVLAPATNKEKLEEIRADIGDCVRCKLHSGRNLLVFGSGNPDADVVFVGEGPGADEDAQGLPFVGRAGQLLTDMINNSAERMNVPLRREHVYICNVVKCRPPANRTPEKDEIEACSPFLMRQIDAIAPRAIVALGSTAVRCLLSTSEPMSKLRGRWFDFRGAKLLITYHPAYLLRDPTKKKEAWQDMQMLLRFIYGKS